MITNKEMQAPHRCFFILYFKNIGIVKIYQIAAKLRRNIMSSTTYDGFKLPLFEQGALIPENKYQLRNIIYEKA